MITSYKDMGIGQYLDICDVLQDKEIADIDKQIAIISILADMGIEEVENLTLDEYGKMAQESWFLKENPKHNPVKTVYEIGDYELVPVLNVKDITVSQYIDYNTFRQMGKEGIYGMLSVFLIPRGKTYCQDYDIDGLKIQLRDMNVEDVMGLSAFFFELSKALIEATRHSLEKKIERMIRKTQGMTEKAQLRKALRDLRKGGAM